MFFNVLKIVLISFLFINLHADFMDDEEDNVITGAINEAKELRAENIRKIWTSSEKEFARYNLSMVGNKIKYDRNGEIAMFLTTERMNIDLDNIFKSMKFDIKHNKEKTYMCSVIVGQETHPYCDSPFYSSAAGADAIAGSALFNITESLFKGTIGTQKRFDKAEFASSIVDHEESIQKIVRKIIMMNLPPDSNEQSLPSNFTVENTAPSDNQVKEEEPKVTSYEPEPEPVRQVYNEPEPNIPEDSTDIGFATHRQSNDTNNFIEDYCRTEWVQMYGEQYPPPRSMEELKIELAESGSQITVKAPRAELYKYNTDIESAEGIPGFSFKANSGKAVKLYKNGDLFIIEGGTETLKAKCRPVDI